MRHEVERGTRVKKYNAIVVITTFGVLLSACGSSSKPSVKTAKSTTTTSTSTTTSPATTTSTTSTTSTPTTVTFPSLAQMQNEANYAYQQVVASGGNTFTTTGVVSSPTAFKFKIGTAANYTVIYNGKQYTVVGNQVYSNQAGSSQSPPLAGFASQVYGVESNTASFTTKRVGTCSQAGLSGISWQIHTKGTASNLGQTYQVCTASATGLLLSVTESGSTTSTASTSTLNQQFSLTAVGNQPPVVPPTAG